MDESALKLLSVPFVVFVCSAAFVTLVTVAQLCKSIFHEIRTRPVPGCRGLSFAPDGGGVDEKGRGATARHIVLSGHSRASWSILYESHLLSGGKGCSMAITTRTATVSDVVYVLSLSLSLGGLQAITLFLSSSTSHCFVETTYL